MFGILSGAETAGWQSEADGLPGVLSGEGQEQPGAVCEVSGSDLPDPDQPAAQRTKKKLHRLTVVGSVPADLYGRPSENIKRRNTAAERIWDDMRLTLMMEWRKMPVKRSAVTMTFCSTSKVIDMAGMQAQVMQLLYRAGVVEFPSPASVPLLAAKYKFAKKNRVEILIREF